jgi:hypothetical protein
MTLVEAHKKFRDYFPGLKLNDYLDPLMMQLTRQPKIDPFKFDDYLHEKHGKYESRKLGMQDLLEKEYGKNAMLLIKALL